MYEERWCGQGSWGQGGVSQNAWCVLWWLAGGCFSTAWLVTAATSLQGLVHPAAVVFALVCMWTSTLGCVLQPTWELFVHGSVVTPVCACCSEHVQQARTTYLWAWDGWMLGTCMPWARLYSSSIEGLGWCLCPRQCAPCTRIAGQR